MKDLKDDLNKLITEYDTIKDKLIDINKNIDIINSIKPQTIKLHIGLRLALCDSLNLKADLLISKCITSISKDNYISYEYDLHLLGNDYETITNLKKQLFKEYKADILYCLDDENKSRLEIALQFLREIDKKLNIISDYLEKYKTIYS